MSGHTSVYSGPRARQVGHRQYDELLGEVIRAVGENTSREDLLTTLLDRLQVLSRADSIVVLEVATGPASASGESVLLGADQRGVNADRWARFTHEHATEVPPGSLAHKVIENGLAMDVWSVQHFREEMQAFRYVFDIKAGGWISGIQLPRATARHNHQGVFIWYKTELGSSALPQGAEQDWRFLKLFRDCYGMAGYNIRKVARSIVMQRQELLRTLTPSILNHEINSRISFFKSGLELAEKQLTTHLANIGKTDDKSPDVTGVRKALRKISKQLLPQAIQLRTISESVMGLTRRIASGKTNPVREIRASIELLAHIAGEANVLVELVTTPGADVEIVTDPALLMHVMVNLIKNAIEALEPLPVNLVRPKRVWIDVTWNDETDAERQLLVDVFDNGEGVPADLAERVFEAGITTKKLGHGLGLAICNMVAGYLGGEIQLRRRSDPTCFRLSLPVQSPKIADLEEELKNEAERP